MEMILNVVVLHRNNKKLSRSLMTKSKMYLFFNETNLNVVVLRRNNKKFSCSLMTQSKILVLQADKPNATIIKECEGENNYT